MAYLPDWDSALLKLTSNVIEERKLAYIQGYKSRGSVDVKKYSSTLSFLSNIFLCEMLLSWHKHKDVAVFKQLAFLSGKAQRMRYLKSPAAGLAYGTARMFTALLSDEPNLIHWFTWHFLPCTAKSKGRLPSFLQPGKLEFHTFNYHLALMGELDWLGERSEEALHEGVKLKPGKSYYYDYLFFKGLAEGKQTLMEESIHKLLSGRIAYTRNNENFMTYQSKVVSTWGLMFAKLAYRNGYKIQIDSPWVPQEWIDIKPIDTYKKVDIFPEFDMFEPFQGESVYFMNGSKFSPIPPSEQQPNIRDLVQEIDWAYP